MFPYMYFLCARTLHTGSAFWIIPLGWYCNTQHSYAAFHLQNLKELILTALQEGDATPKDGHPCLPASELVGPARLAAAPAHPGRVLPPQRASWVGICFSGGTFSRPLQPWETALSLGQELTFSGKRLGFSVQESICFASESSFMQKILVLKYLAAGFFFLSLLFFCSIFSLFHFFFFFYYYYFSFSWRGKPSASRCRAAAVAAGSPTDMPAAWVTDASFKKCERTLTSVSWTAQCPRTATGHTLLLLTQGSDFFLALALLFPCILWGPKYFYRVQSPSASSPAPWAEQERSKHWMLSCFVYGNSDTPGNAF